MVIQNHDQGLKTGKVSKRLDRENTVKGIK